MTAPTPLKDALVARYAAHDARVAARRAERPPWWEHARAHGAWASLRCALVDECADCADPPPATVITVADLVARLGRRGRPV